MLDAFGKPPEGILEGQLHWPGAYDYCEEYEVEYLYNYTDGRQEVRRFTGKYTRLNIDLPVSNLYL